MQKSDQPATRKLDLFFCLLFILFWIVPFTYSNLTKKKVSFFPSFISAILSTSNLFTRANYIWPVPYMQVLLEEEGRWITLNEEDYFSMPTFGYRTRLFEALYLAVNEPEKSLAVQRELAYWVALRHQVLNNALPISVRFVSGLYRVKPGKRIHGHWQKPPLNTFAGEGIYEISRHAVTEPTDD